jgi:tetratricopeptide (TPR) repeat protein
MRWFRRVIIAAALARAGAGAAQEVETLESLVGAGRYAEALAYLDESWDRMEGTPAQKHLLRAGLLNHLGRHEEAGKSAEEARRAVGEADIASAAADAELQRGTSLFGLKQYGTAEVAFQAALDGGTTRPAEARALLGMSLAAQKRFEEAQEELDRAAEEMDRESVFYDSAQRWREHVGRILAEGEQKPFGVKFKFGPGMTTNALRFSPDAQLPGGVSDAGTFTLETGLTAWWDAVRDPDWRVRISDAVTLKLYDRARSFSRLGNRLGVQVTHELDEDLTVGAAFAWEVNWLLDPMRQFSHVYEPSVFGEYRWSPMTQTRLSVSHPFTEYDLDGLDGPLDPSGHAVRVRVEQIVFLDEARRWALVPAAGVAFNEARGSDWDYVAYDASLALAGRPLDELQFQAGIYASVHDFRHANSVALFDRARHDESFGAFVSATYRINDWLGLTAQVSYTNTRSNIDVFEYDAFEWAVLPALDLGSLLGSVFGGGAE